MAPQLRWIWVRLTANRREVLSIIALIAIVGIAALAFIKYPVGSRATNFGPDWDCVNVGKGDPVCVKKPAANSAIPAPATR